MLIISEKSALKLGYICPIFANLLQTQWKVLDGSRWFVGAQTWVHRPAISLFPQEGRNLSPLYSLFYYTVIC